MLSAFARARRLAGYSRSILDNLYMTPTGFVSFDQFLCALSEWLAPIVVASHMPEILDLYCGGESVADTAEAVGLIHLSREPNTSVI